MLLLLIALLQTAEPSSQETKATLQSCETTEKGWVCHYQIPQATIVRPLDPAPPTTMVPPPPATLTVPGPQAPQQPPQAPVVAPIDNRAEAARQTRLIARCADAKWYSPCLPGERKEAQILREAALNAAALRGHVTTLLSEKRCDDAVKTALEGGDLALAREAREFCAVPQH
ncbi:hypothetical protein [Caulobacter sp. FWC2]|uniref:hypothetical protein n=1 Tax=Caulobacter sp. FWC2 TaxID=69664 RepID=UPI000C15BE9E|nr:hypothetical protein [Caulobacter sp. FWC2]PIB91560.1 hypothetical protein CSW62_08220 [Caulobacter sp. FWC2]